jgi:hypothetical protein
MTEPNGTNGHPSSPPPPQREEPAPREPTRHLVVDVRDGDLILDSVEPTLGDVLRWLEANAPPGFALRSPIVTNQITVNGSASAAEVGDALVGAMRSAGFSVDDVTPPASTTSEAFDRAFAETSEKAGGKMPSERIVELHRENEGMQIEPGSLAERCGWQVALVAMFLDEQWRERGGR